MCCWTDTRRVAPFSLRAAELATAWLGPVAAWQTVSEKAVGGLKGLVVAGPAPPPLLRAQRMAALSQRLALLIRSLTLGEQDTGRLRRPRHHPLTLSGFDHPPRDLTRARGLAEEHLGQFAPIHRITGPQAL
ncbi:MAG: hypothetical protein ABSD29_18430 [Verrucomicrobiota bacterium]